ncbi:MAG: ribosome small subunit-dependent GTPase A, partial [Oscillospiraceae bacterium]|nr:ribosome small subunit-dependent GTPase A [Oscillospiraceae bacterium]
MRDDHLRGIILKGIGGFYYVHTEEGVLECKAKGLFRKQGITPLAGDRVQTQQSGGGLVISEIEARKNHFNRPPIANVDNFFLVVSAVEPLPNILVIDRLTLLCEKRGIRPTILLSKTDLAPAPQIHEIYSAAGYEVIEIMADEAAAVQRVKELCKDKLSVFSGNTGVGKSTFLNKLYPELELATNAISKKLGRGKHTTRAVELYAFEGGWLADTPGFSALDFERLERTDKKELAPLFPEFRPHTENCYFTGCSHTVEKGCAVLQALADGHIHPSRHESYCYLYKEA